MDTIVPVPLAMVGTIKTRINRALQAAKKAGVGDGTAEISHHVKISTRGLGRKQHNQLIEQFIKPALK